MEEYLRTYCEIDLKAIRENYINIKKKTGDKAMTMAVIKADGYGHGAVPIAKEIEHLDYVYGYAAATVEEGMILRNNGIQKPILILGYIFPDQYEEVIQAEICPSVFTLEMAKELSAAAEKVGKDCRMHFAVDTGMSRIGYQVTEEAADEMAQIAKLPHMIVEGIFTHFAKADEYDKTFTKEQIQKFKKMIAMMEDRGVSIPVKHCSNSAGIAEIREANMDMVRAGITLYGMWPSEEVAHNISLHPVMSLKSHIAFVKTLEKGRKISYGGIYETPSEKRIATIPVGYADGYARGLSNKGYVLIHGKKAPICGRVCMDQFMVDVTEIPEAKEGDPVTLLGKDGSECITMEELGELSGRFNYEFACLITPRVPRICIQES